jgi:hypothetical protein
MARQKSLENEKSNGKIKYLSLFCFALLILSIWLMVKTPADNYEASIYSSTPLPVWIFLIFSLVVGLGISAHQVYTKSYEVNHKWVWGVSLVAASSILLSSVHAFRSYYNLGGDMLAHLAFIQNFLKTGRMEAQNQYPAIHYFIAYFSKFTGIGPARLLIWVHVPFYFIYIYSLYLMSKTIFREKGKAIIATSLGIPQPIYMILFYGTPYNMSILLSPLILFIFLKAITKDDYTRFVYWAVLVAAMFLFPYLHPLTAAFLLVIMVVSGLSVAIYRMFRREYQVKARTYAITGFLVVALLVWIFLRVSSFEVIPPSLQPNVEVTSQQSTADAPPSSSPSGVESIIASVRLMESYGYSFPVFFLKREALPILYLILSAFALVWVIRKRDPLLMSLSASMIIMGFLSLTSVLTSYGQYLSRILSFIILLIPLSAAIPVHNILEKLKVSVGNKLVFGVLSILIVACIINSALMSYASRYSLQPNDQITRYDVEGMDWFLKNKDSDIHILTLSYQAYRLKYLFMSYADAKARTDIESYPPILTPPYHFGYDRTDELGELVGTDYYMLINQEDKVLYTDIWPEIVDERFTRQAFARLHSDPSLELIYSNAGLDIWHIHAVK